MEQVQQLTREISAYSIISKIELYHAPTFRIDIAVGRINEKLFILVVKLVKFQTDFLLKSFIAIPTEGYFSPVQDLNFLDFYRRNIDPNDLKDVTNFTVNNSFDICKSGASQYVARIVIINHLPYVALIKLWWNDIIKGYLPTKRQVYLNSDAFEKLLESHTTLQKLVVDAQYSLRMGGSCFNIIALH